VNGCGLRVLSGRSPSSPRPSAAGSCRTPRSAPSPAWPRRRRKLACPRGGARAVDRRAEARETARRHASQALHVRTDEDGMVVVSGRLEPEVGALLIQALATARGTLYQRAGRGGGGAGAPG